MTSNRKKSGKHREDDSGPAENSQQKSEADVDKNKSQSEQESEPVKENVIRKQSYVETLKNYNPEGGQRIEPSKPEDTEWQSKE